MKTLKSIQVTNTLSLETQTIRVLQTKAGDYCVAVRTFEGCDVSESGSLKDAIKLANEALAEKISQGFKA